jgi:sigma-B regulation protein RsbU (phosphoserine phosphatase)
VFDPDAAADPTARPYYQWPPGIVDRGRDIEGVELRAGLWVPLVAQGENVGLMVVHSTRRKAFEVSEMAMLEAFAGHAALAVQRTRLVEELEGKIAELEAAQAELRVKERMEAELALAREVQQSLLPRTFPLLPGFRFAAHNEPARQVGGDFYDVFVLDEGRFGLVVADVSDKGMPAALYMALSRSLLLAEARRPQGASGSEASPALVLAQVNRLLRELAEPDMFVSMFYGVVDVATRRMRYARAGHDRPILLRAGQSVELGGRGALLGVFGPDELLLTEEELALRPGDRLALFTDGLTDAFSPA